MKNKKWLFALITISISCFLTFLAAEMAFRYLLFSDNPALKEQRKPAYYADFIKNPAQSFFNEDYWKLHHFFTDFKHATKNVHPLLGWISWYFDGKTYQHKEEKFRKGRRPVLLFGDSFARCVNNVTCFQSFLNADSSFAKEHYFFNYGVGGYGIDQIYLLYSQVIDQHEDPFVVMSFMTRDIDRSLLKIRDGQKPYFILEDDELQLQDTPIDSSARHYVYENPPEITSYLFNKMKLSDWFPFWKDQSKRRDERKEKIKTLNEKLFETIIEDLERRNIDYVFLIFHPLYKQEVDWRNLYIRELFEEEYKVPYIWANDLIKEDNAFEEYSIHNYAIKHDGHPTTHYNGLVAHEIKRYILDPSHADKVKARNIGTYASWKHQATGEMKAYSTEEYYYLIKNNNEWFHNVKTKAKERGIPVDSMLWLDAQYMMEQQNK